MKHSTPLVFFGSDDFSLPSLQALRRDGYDVALVVSKALPSKQSGRQSAASPIYGWAKAERLPLATPEHMDEAFLDQLDKAESEYAVLASYGKILPANVLDRFKAIINVHPSLLPRWRGPSPIEAAILAGDETTGVSLMQLSKDMDAGPVYGQRQINLTGKEDQATLTHALAELGAGFLSEQLPLILSGQRAAREQDTAAASYCRLIKKSDGAIDWQEPALDIERKVRAYRSWPKASAKLYELDVIITQAHVVAHKGPPGEVFQTKSAIGVMTGDGALIIERLKPAGKNEMSAAEFLRGYVRG